MVHPHNRLLCSYKKEWRKTQWTDKDWFPGCIVNEKGKIKRISIVYYPACKKGDKKIYMKISFVQKEAQKK